MRLAIEIRDSADGVNGQRAVALVNVLSSLLATALAEDLRQTGVAYHSMRYGELVAFLRADGTNIV
jgi:hypothetical protein